MHNFYFDQFSFNQLVIILSFANEERSIVNYYYYSSMINSREILRFLSFDKLGNRYRYETSIYKRNFFNEDLLLKDFMYVNFISRFFFSIESILSRKIFFITT